MQMAVHPDLRVFSAPPEKQVRKCTHPELCHAANFDHIVI
jgi:hypothetical protein